MILVLFLPHYCLKHYVFRLTVFTIDGVFTINTWTKVYKTSFKYHLNFTPCQQDMKIVATNHVQVVAKRSEHLKLTQQW